MKSWNLSRVFGALFVFVVALVVYVRTMAVSVSFWDCGEFIACAHILGVPHPPGTPLYILVGRLFSLLPLFGTVARRVNFLSALSGALAVGMLYVVTERVARGWFGEGMGWRGRLLAMVGGVTAGLWMAFSDTYWSNVVEAEVYAPAMFLMVLVTWLGLRWQQVRGERGGDNLLVLLMYVLFLCVGIHMVVFMVAAPLFLLVVLTDRDRLYDWRFWLVVLALVTVVTSVDWFLRFSLLALGVSFVGMWVGGVEGRGRWRFCFWLVLLGLLGYTVQAFLPLRSMLNPAIDENDPQTWERFKMLLERKQYGQQSMLETMFRRKGSWVSQFGVHRRMGFWGFFRQGWAPVGWWPLVVGVGVLGMVVGWFRGRRWWLYLMVLMVICSFGLVLWMNFSDGTRGVQLEVRDRDYFFTPAYVYFSLWMGLGVSGLLWLVLRYLRGVSRGILFWVLVVLVLVSPLGSMVYNYHRHDRSGNYIAHDYGYNLLNSCDRDAVLFTNGDNDTFPLWYMQEVEGVRKDVRVVNLSLLNTAWYIKQLGSMEPKVQTGYTDEQADRLMPIRWPEDKEIDLGGIFLPLKRGQILRVQDRAALNIIRANRWKRPIYFAITVSPDNKIDLDRYLEMESMALKLVPKEGSTMINLERTLDLVMNQHLFRGLNDEAVFKNENTKKLLTNYAAVFSALGQVYCGQGKFEEARVVLERGLEVLYPFWGLYQVLSRAYEGLGELEKGLEAGHKALSMVGENDRAMIYMSLLPLYEKTGRLEEFSDYLNGRIEANPVEFSAYWALFRTYHMQGKSMDAAKVLEKWLIFHPQDNNTRRFWSEYLAEIESSKDQAAQQ